MLSVLITLLVVVVVVGLIFYVLREFPMPEPLNKVIRVAAVVIGVVVILYALIGALEPGMMPRLR